jgi:hypothetical protein
VPEARHLFVAQRHNGIDLGGASSRQIGCEKCNKRQ